MCEGDLSLRLRPAGRLTDILRRVLFPVVSWEAALGGLKQDPAVDDETKVCLVPNAVHVTVALCGSVGQKATHRAVVKVLLDQVGQLAVLFGRPLPLFLGIPELEGLVLVAHRLWQPPQ